MANIVSTLWDIFNFKKAKQVDTADRHWNDNRNSALNYVIERYNYRVRKDIAQWKLALQQAENKDSPRRILLYSVYDDAILDNHISSLIEHQRREKLFSKQFRIVDIKTNDIDPELTQFFNRKWFFDFMELALDSKWWGHSLIQMGDIIIDPVTDQQTMEVPELIPRRHVIPERGLLLMEQYDQTGIFYRGEPALDYLIEVGKKADLGLLNKAAAPFITRKNAMMAWSEFLEVFGMPLRTGFTPSTQQADLDRMGKALRDMGSAAYAVFREGERVEFTETSKGDSAGIYDGLIERCTNDLSKLFAGQTMTHENGSSKAQGSVHENTADDVTQADQRFISAVVNENLLPYLMSRGVNVKNKQFEYPEQTDLAALYTQVVGLLPSYFIPAEWIEQIFGIPVEEKSPAPAPNPPTDPAASEEEEASPPPPTEGEESSPDDDTKEAMRKAAKKELHEIASLHLAIDKTYNP